MRFLKLIFAAALMTAILSINASAASNLPEKIRVGLYFKGSAVSSFNLSSDTGFDVGYESKGTFKSLFTDSSSQTAVVQKDNYSGGQTAANHIQVGETYDDYASTQTIITQLKEKNYKAYAAYDTNWRVWVGEYGTSTQANADITKLKKDLKENTYTLVQTSDKSIRFVVNNQLKFIFAGNDTNFEVYPVVKGSSPNVLGVNNTKYRGSIRVIRNSSSDMTVIDVVSLEQYLYGVVPSEMPSSWNLEALKAQAVAARTYAVTHINNGLKGTGTYSSIGFDVDPTTAFQAYGGYSREQASTKKAVDDTKGVCAYYNNSLITAFFFASDGGYTEASENVWSNPLPYLKAVEDKYQPAEFSRKTWTNKATPDQIKTFLAAKKKDIGDIVDVQVLNYSKSGSALTLRVVGTKGNYELQKDNIRIFMRGFNPDKNQSEFLYSQYFKVSKEGDAGAVIIGGDLQKITVSLRNAKVNTKNGQSTINGDGPIYIKSKDATKPLNIVKQPQTFVFTGGGHGHGVGMSQWGAKGMGDAGFKYDQILKYYYTGIELK